ncbi:SLC13 family permease [Pseudalkalibacillus salsuginis]|uniref:SLC13 family permease n=1 Tax=Pseudalkalibacillus salsuginis TaxID=2910972 RepID=UPI001F41C2A0|nr:SLC13 family permease [Pseudalkalibacillus salsuginis]MCF6409149.1 SLC13 family permease [Pseudalkalibacillus salsuginis]
MITDIWITYIVIGVMLLFLLTNVYSAEVIVLSAVLVLIWSGVLSLTEAFGGFINEGVLTIASLFIVMNSIQKHPSFSNITKFVFGNKQTLRSGMSRMMVVTGGLSSFMNNTPLVVLFTPIVKRWAEKQSIFPSKLLIPLSYAAIIGGMCTLIGTSTNLVLHTLLLREGYKGFSLFELAYIGVPFFIIALFYMLFFGYRLLPQHDTNYLQKIISPKFIVEVKVNEQFSGTGKTLEEAGLRHLKKCYVMAVLRQGEWIFPVSPTQKVNDGDHLLFVGDETCSQEIEHMRGLVIEHSRYDFTDHHNEFKLVEATVPQHSSYVSERISDIKFRTRHGGIVVAVYRKGRRINEKIGSIRLKSGDMLVVLTTNESLKTDRASKNLLVLDVYPTDKNGTFKDWIPIGLFGLMLLLVSFGLVQIAHAAITTAIILILLKVTTFDEAMEAIKWDILFIIGGAFGIATAMTKSGAADSVVNLVFLNLDAMTPFILLMSVYLVTNILTEIITNNAAVVIMFPIVLSFVNELSLNPHPFAVVLAIAASASFSTPIGYQTNLLVYSSGQYRFADFIRVGLPLNIIGFIMTMTIVPLLWPLS